MSETTPPPTDVDADITPITQKPIDPVSMQDWANCTLSQLYNQQTVLQNRYFTALELEKPELAAQIDSGLNQIKAAIKLKETKQQQQGFIHDN